MGKVKAREIYLEFRAQITRVLGEGLTITHLDSHEHVHMFPEIFNITLKLASEFKIPYVRLPLESAAVIKRRFSVKDLTRHMALKVFALSGKGRISGSVLYHNDNFLGHFHSGRLDDDIMCFMMENLPEGVSEIAVHPGKGQSDIVEESPWHRNAEVELDVLLKGSWKKRAKSEGIRFVTHREAVSA